MADFQRFQVARCRHGGGTGVFQAFRRPFREGSDMDGTPIHRPRRSWTAPNGSGGFPGRLRAEGLHGGSAARITAFCGLSEASCGFIGAFDRPQACCRPRWSPASRAGRLVSAARPWVYPIMKLGRRCRKFWGGCSPSFSDTVHPGMEKPRQHRRGLVLGAVRRSSSFLGSPSRNRRAPSRPKSS